MPKLIDFYIQIRKLEGLRDAIINRLLYPDSEVGRVERYRNQTHQSLGQSDGHSWH